MPHNKIHEELSERRTGNSFADLHDWMCGPGLARKELEQRHRVTKILENVPYVRERWGDVGVSEYLYHIQDDFERHPAIRLTRFFVRRPVIWPLIRVASYIYNRLMRRTLP